MSLAVPVRRRGESRRRVTYQCGRCRKRWRFTQRLEQMQRRPSRLRPDWTCGACGGNLHPTGRFIKAWNERQETCHCGIIPYPHRKGSCHAELLCPDHPRFQVDDSPWLEGDIQRSHQGGDEPPF